MEVPESIRKLAGELSQLPSIGPRQAMRLAFYLAHRGRTVLSALSTSIAGIEKLKTCELCFFLHENGGAYCDICSNGSRNKKVIMIVEKDTDLLSMENAHRYQGRYLVLGEMPRTGILTEEQRKRLQILITTLSGFPDKKADEVIMGFNPTGLGDFHTSLVTKEITPYTQKISRLGRGLPSGGEIEFADDETLGSALAGRS